MCGTFKDFDFHQHFVALRVQSTLCVREREEVELTDLVPQHPLQPVLPSSGQIDGQCGSAALHHHHGLRQQLVRETHHHLGGDQRKSEELYCQGEAGLAS